MTGDKRNHRFLISIFNLLFDSFIAINDNIPFKLVNMKKYLYTLSLTGSLLLSATTSHAHSLSKTEWENKHSFLSTVRVGGAQTAADLTQNYSHKAIDCGSSTKPAFLCSGVLLRGTNTFSTSYHSWDPSPTSVESGGVSFSYLRIDSKYSKLAYSYNNGFIFFPFFNAPDNEGIDTDIDIMCSFPIDAATESRADKGCGASYVYPTQSGPCQEQDIFTADEWYSHYSQGNENHTYQCGFTIDDYSNYDTASAFYQTILSMAKISSESIKEQNELRLATWAQGKQDSLPIQAFFYVNGSNAGKTSAQNNQKDYFNSTTNNIWIPVIKITLPATTSDDASFIYSKMDQLIPEPTTKKQDVIIRG